MSDRIVATPTLVQKVLRNAFPGYHVRVGLRYDGRTMDASLSPECEAPGIEAPAGSAWNGPAMTDLVAPMSSLATAPEGPGRSDVYLVHCTLCNKTHSVVAGAKPCAPGAWIDPSPIGGGR